MQGTRRWRCGRAAGQRAMRLEGKGVILRISKIRYVLRHVVAPAVQAATLGNKACNSSRTSLAQALAETRLRVTMTADAPHDGDERRRQHGDARLPGHGGRGPGGPAAPQPHHQGGARVLAAAAAAGAAWGMCISVCELVLSGHRGQRPGGPAAPQPQHGCVY